MTRVLLLCWLLLHISCLRENFYDSAQGPDLNRKKWDLMRNYHQPTSSERLSIRDGSFFFELSSESELKNSGGGVNHLRLRAKQAPSEMNFASAIFSIGEARYVSCDDAKALPLFSRVALGKFIFKAGAATKSKIENDVLVVTGIYQDPKEFTGSTRAFALVLKCGDPCYVLNEYIPSDAPKSEVLFRQDLGAVVSGSKIRLAFHWKAKEKQIVFFKENAPLATYNYSLDDSQPPHISAPQIDIGHFVPNCIHRPTKIQTKASFSELIFEQRP